MRVASRHLGGLTMSRRVLIADDHPMLANALSMACHAADPAIHVDIASNFAEAEALVSLQKPDLVLLDLMLPDIRGFTGLAVMRALCPDMPIAIVTSRDEPAIIRQAVGLGARGFISKATAIDRMIAATRILLDGGQWLPAEALIPDSAGQDLAMKILDLSPAQLKVVRSIASGAQNKQIAYELGVAEPTVKSHLVAIYRKLGVSNTTQAVLLLKAFEPQEPQSETL